MKRLTAIAILVAAVIGTSYVGNVGAATRTTQPMAVYTCHNEQESVALYSGHTPYNGFWIQIQSNTWAMKFNSAFPISVEGRPGLRGEQQGAEITVVILNNGSNLVVEYGKKPVFKCDYVEDRTLVNWTK